MLGTEKPMSLREMADYLKMAEQELGDMAQRGDIPARRVRSQWTFVRSMVDDWLIGYMKQLPKEDLKRLIATEGSPVSLKSLVRPELVSAAVRPGTKAEVLAQLVFVLAHNEVILPGASEQFVERLMEREDMVSTAIFGGAAIPHFRNPEDAPIKRPVVVVGLCPQGTDFDSLDMEPTYLFFLVCAGNELLHLKLIAETALLLRRTELIERVRRARGELELIAELFA